MYALVGSFVCLEADLRSTDGSLVGRALPFVRADPPNGGPVATGGAPPAGRSRYSGSTEEVLVMSRYDYLVGQSFERRGSRLTIVKCDGSTVIAAMMHGGRVERVMVSLAEVLDALEVTEITVTELPPVRRPLSAR